MTANPAADAALVARRRDCVHGVELDSESVLYDEQRGTLHLLNWSASAVWWSLDGVSTADEVAEELAATFNASRPAIRNDVLGLLAMLEARELIEPVASDG